MPEPRDTAAVRVTWKGKVQGVWFRGFVIDNATELGLKGWVRNRPDGTVEAEIIGDGPTINDLLRRCRQGPPAARVDEAIAEPIDVPEPVPDGFVQRETG